MPTVLPRAKIECTVRCGICGRTETMTYVNAKTITALKAQTQTWKWRPKQEYNVCPECYAQRISRGRKHVLVNAVTDTE